MARSVGRGRPIVIVGGGFAGAYCAQRLERLLGRDSSRVLLIDRHNYFVFSPLLIEAGTGSLEPRHAVVSTRSFLRRARFAMGEVTDIDPEAHTVSYRPAGRGEKRVVEYEHLVLAPGSVISEPPVDGLARFGWPMKSLEDTVALRDRAIEMLEAADGEFDPAARATMLRFVVVGGSFTGVEVAGEFDVFLRRAIQRYPNLNRRDYRVTLIEQTDRILPALDEDLAQYAAHQLRFRGLELFLNNTITRIGADFVDLRDGKRVPSRTVIWCAGIAPSPLLKPLNLPKDPRGFLLCEPDLRVRGCDSVWAIGDSAVNCDEAGVPYPATAQHAIAEGRAAARNIAATLAGRATRPLRYRSKGSLAPLGCRTAVAKVMGVKLSGLTAWFLWRTVYLMKMPGFARKLRVAIDWSLDWFFTKDYVGLGLRRQAMAPTAVPVVKAALPPVEVPRVKPFPLAPQKEISTKPVLPVSEIAAQMARAHDDEED